MKRPASTCSGILLIGILFALGCGGSAPGTADERPDPETTSSDPRGFDPLELPRDRQVMALKYERTGDIAGKQVIIESTSGTDPDSLGAGQVGPDMAVDTVNSQVYRVQLFTSRVYGDGRQAARVAEEIFDQPVYVDYEVPNYKVRVGNFMERNTAEDYQQRVRAAGYTNAWVVMVNVGIQEVAPLYQEDTDLFLPIPEPSDEADTTTTDEEAADGSEN